MPDRSSHHGDLLAALLARASQSISDPSPSERRALRQLDDFRQRLETERFQVAVLGQFKRGKSTLLNALLGASVLPTAVVPLTAIPTFIEGVAAPCIRAVFRSGAIEEAKAPQPEEMSQRLSQLVTEEANPNNLLGLVRVDVFLPCPLLKQGVVLIDTPGVGSTFLHNTETAEATLPACDTALFVVSPDPPITEVEISYLKRVQANVARLIVVVNKVDAIEPHDLAPALEFLRRTLSKEANVDASVPLFRLSARAALRAKQTRDQEALASSGLPELEAYLGDFLVRDKSAALEAAIARKAVAVCADLQLETDIRLRALQLPIKDLDGRLATFDRAMVEFDEQRRVAHDLLAGDRRRVLEQIESDAEELRRHARTALEAELDQTPSLENDGESARRAVLEKVAPLFETELERSGSSLDERMKRTLAAHAKRIDELNNTVRQTAASVMAIEFRRAEQITAIEYRHEPYWVTSNRVDMASPIAPGALDRFLPASTRKRRIRRRLQSEIETLVRRNVENLRWAARQNVEDAFRRFDAALDELFTDSIETTRNVIVAARDRRLNQADRIEAETSAVQSRAQVLSEVRSALLSLA
jgi:GTP-binding protein EngB required for normal cell division